MEYLFMGIFFIRALKSRSKNSRRIPLKSYET